MDENWWSNLDQINKIGKLINKTLIQSWIAQKLRFLVVGVNIFYDFETFSISSSNFGICFQIFF